MSAHVKKTPKKPAKPKTPAKKPATPVRNLQRPEYYVNRELSWLEFNQRVLDEALDETNPLLERLKFLAIVSSNLDEFFEVRVAGLQQQSESQPGSCEADGLTPDQTLDEIHRRVAKMVAAQYRCYRASIVPGLAAHGVDLLTVDELNAKGRAWVRDYFEDAVFPVLTPLAIDPSHPFPQLLNKSLNLAVLLGAQRAGRPQGELFENWNPVQSGRLGVVQVPRALPRLVQLPAALMPAGRTGYVFLSSVISAHINRLFPGLEVLGCYAFRVTRNSELYVDEDEADNLLEAMHEELQRRRRGDAVRLEVQRGCDPRIVEMLLSTFELEAMDLFEVDGPVNLTRLMAVYDGQRQPALIDPAIVPQVPRSLRHIEDSFEFFAALRAGDVLLHHPYDSFQPVVDFVSLAAGDPQVLAIKQTLYRTSGNSPIVHALMNAARAGKQVTAIVELKARFDEENNIQWARQMEEAGVHVLYGLVGLKTHCKMALVVRREEHGVLRRYAHLGTGNYNEVTARLYTDVGLLTARPEIGEDVAAIFNLMTGMSQFTGLQKLHAAPFRLNEAFIELIERETQNALKMRNARVPSGRDGMRNGKAPKAPHSKARIIVKMNSLVDPEMIRALYRASQAGVKVDLIVRGICCLRPGVPGVSENITVRSVVDRFLEHSRVFYFANGGDEEIFCGSADWMPRNFFRRLEVVFPVSDKVLKKRLKDEVLLSALRDNVKARVMKSDGSYVRARRKTGEEPLRSQEILMRQSAGEERELPKPESGELTLIPRAQPPQGTARTVAEGDVVMHSLGRAMRGPAQRVEGGADEA